jgi:hypothetical protein
MNGFSRQCVVIPAASWKAIDTDRALFFCCRDNHFPLETCKWVENMQIIMLRTLGMHVLVKKKTGVIIVR